MHDGGYDHNKETEREVTRTNGFRVGCDICRGNTTQSKVSNKRFRSSFIQDEGIMNDSSYALYRAELLISLYDLRNVL